MVLRVLAARHPGALGRCAPHELEPRPPGAPEPSAADDGAPDTSGPLDRTVRIVFVGGNESQHRYRTAVEASLADRYQGKVEIAWYFVGWSSNWRHDLERIAARLPGSDAVVLLSFMRTMLGERLRQAAGDAGVPWVPCTGHGRASIERAIDCAVRVACQRLPARTPAV